MDRIKYIWHDCFVVMMPQANFIFDYWKDPAAPETGRGHIPGFLSRLSRDVPTFVLVSHGHKDHYNPDIFSFAEVIPDIRYIVSNDVYRRTRHITMLMYICPFSSAKSFLGLSAVPNRKCSSTYEHS